MTTMEQQTFPSLTAEERLWVALDVKTADEALALVKQLKPSGIQTVKVGMRLFYQEGQALLDTLHREDIRVFLDLKLYDIPNTVSQAMANLVHPAVSVVNVHASGGKDMMTAAVASVHNRAEQLGLVPPQVIAVTILTSFSQASLSETLNQPLAPEAMALHLAKLAYDSGVNGVVCSPLEAKAISQACGEGFVRVTPGIRPAGSDANDQQRLMTPANALAAGSTYLVVGRPIIQAPSPLEAANLILSEMKA